jgi:hypothetical protein
MLAEHPADRLDPETVPVSVDEGDYLCDWRSSSDPKKGDAALRIGFTEPFLTAGLLPTLAGLTTPDAGSPARFWCLARR